MKRNFFNGFILALIVSSCSSPLEELAAGASGKVASRAVAIGKSSLAGSARVTAGMTLTQINAVIAGTTAGDTVWVEAGTYEIDGALVLKPGITMMKSGTVNPVFDSRSSTAQLFRQNYSISISNLLVTSS